MPVLIMGGKLKATIESFGLKGLNIGLILLLTIGINKYYPVDDAAIFFTILNFVLILSVSGAMGLDLQFFAHGDNRVKEASIQSGSLTYFFIRLFFQVMLVAIAATAILDDVGLNMWIIIVLSAIIFSINLIYAEYLRSVDKPNQQLISNGLIFYISLVAAILSMNILELNIGFQYMILLSSFVVLAYHLLFKLDNILGFSLTAKIALRNTKEQASFAIYSWLVLVLPQLPLLIIVLAEESNQIVDFNVIMKLAGVYGLPIVVLTARFFPEMKRLYFQSNKDEFKKLYIFILKVSSALTTIGFIVSYILLSNQSISNMINIDWSTGFVVMFIAHLVSALSGPNILTLAFCIGKKYAIFSSATALIPLSVFVLYDLSITSLNLIFLTASMITITNIAGSFYVLRYVVSDRAIFGK